MKIADFVSDQATCFDCVLSQPRQGDSTVWCPIKDRLVDEDDFDTCGSWYLELTTPPNPELIGDKPHKVVYIHDFGSWLNLYQCPKPPHIRVLSREEWPEVKEV